MKEINTKTNWQSVQWAPIEKFVLNMQKRIYKASVAKNKTTLTRLQRVLLKSEAGKLKAIRRVTQDNKGKRTAGVDGKKQLTPIQRMDMIHTMKMDGSADPIRRVYIEKGEDSTETRPLGIPTMKDRAKQALALLALEPEWEAKFEPNSYGFRPGRGCHDAIEAIYISINQKPKYVLEADIEGCFNNIDHDSLINKLDTFPEMERQVRAWLKSGVLEDRIITATQRGVPQGGIISPLLMNVALHGLEIDTKKHMQGMDRRSADGKALPGRTRTTALSIIRYADDFVVLHEDIEVVNSCRSFIEVWMSRIGLRLKDAKTRVSHTRKTVDNQTGFDFLGFNIRQYPIGWRKIRKTKASLKFRTLIKPSKRKVIDHLRVIKETFNSTKDTTALIALLNPKIIGWARYYHTVVSSSIFNWCNARIYHLCEIWVRKKHPTQTRKWQNERYFHTVGPRNWVFGYLSEDKELITLKQYTDVPIRRHTKVIGTRSPYDGRGEYWSNRINIYPLVSVNVKRLMKQQEGKCAWCKQRFLPMDVIERDHIIPISQGGKHSRENFQLLHGHCHRVKTTTDLKNVQNRIM